MPDGLSIIPMNPLCPMNIDIRYLRISSVFNKKENLQMDSIPGLEIKRQTLNKCAKEAQLKSEVFFS